MRTSQSTGQTKDGANRSVSGRQAGKLGFFTQGPEWVPDSGFKNEYEQGCGNEESCSDHDSHARKVLFNDAGAAICFTHTTAENTGNSALAGMQENQHYQQHGQHRMYAQN